MSASTSSLATGWQLDGINLNDDWSSMAFLRVFADPAEDGSNWADSLDPVGYILIVQEKGASSDWRELSWKFACGHKDKSAGEDPFETVQREVCGETGLSQTLVHYEYVGSEWHARKMYWTCNFTGDIFQSQLETMGADREGNEGERPQYFTAAEFKELVRGGQIHGYKLLPAHLEVLRRYQLVPSDFFSKL